MRIAAVHASNARRLVLALAIVGISTSFDLADFAPGGAAARTVVGSPATNDAARAMPAKFGFGLLSVAQAVSGVPTIESLSPASGGAGSSITVIGTNFTSENVVRFHGGQMSFEAGSPVAALSPTTLRFALTTCPSYAPRCPGVYIPSGVYEVTVANANGVSNQARFTVTSP